MMNFSMIFEKDALTRLNSIHKQNFINTYARIQILKIYQCLLFTVSSKHYSYQDTTYTDEVFF